jgi:hypothetical protein
MLCVAGVLMLAPFRGVAAAADPDPQELLKVARMASTSSEAAANSAGPVPRFSRATT